MYTTEIVQRFEALVRREGDTLGRLLAAAQRAVGNETLRELGELGHELSPTQLEAIQQICLSGGRAADLVERLGMTKQAVGQVLSSLETAGWVRREPDPNDARVRLVFYTKNGLRMLSDVLDVTQRVERRLTKAIGKVGLKELKTKLSAVEAP